MIALMTWLDEIDAALVGPTPTAAAEHRLDALIDQGVSLLTDVTPAGSDELDPQLLDRVQRRLRTIADEVAAELDAIRRERRNLTRAERAHARYRGALVTP